MKIIKLKISKRILRYMKDIIRKLKEQKFITKVDVSEEDYKEDITQTGDPDEIIKYVESKYEPEHPEYPITKESNSALMYIMHKAGLAASEDFMTWDEVEAVTSEGIKPQFASGISHYNISGSGNYSLFAIKEDPSDLLTNFDEFKYFIGVESLSDILLWPCLSLKTVTIPKSVTSKIYGSSFMTNGTMGKKSIGLEKLNVDSENPKYDSRNNCNAIIETESNTLVAGIASTIIPDSVTSIGDSAFQDLDNLKNITIPASVTSIGQWAFQGDTGLIVEILSKSAPQVLGSPFNSDVTIKVPKDATGYDVTPWTNYTIERLEE